MINICNSPVLTMSSERFILCVGIPDESRRDQYIHENNDDPLRALIKACGDGDLGAVMALSSMVDVNAKLPRYDSKWYI